MHEVSIVLFSIFRAFFFCKVVEIEFKFRIILLVYSKFLLVKYVESRKAFEKTMLKAKTPLSAISKGCLLDEQLQT